jgi:topoisomerase-4 subunit A
VVNLKDKAKLAIIRPIPEGHDHVAVIGENRKLLVFPLDALPVMARGQGVALQKYKDGGLADATTLKLADGLSWKLQGDSGRMRTETDLTPWLLSRAAAGRLPPQGFPKDNKFQ